MGRTYAGVLGCLAFSMTLIRGALGGHAPDSVLLTATIGLFAFAALGWMVGAFAEITVVNASRQRFETEFRAVQSGSETGKSGSGK